MTAPSTRRYLEPTDKHSCDYCQPWQCELRDTAHDGVCVDEDCDLSGGYAHAGFCDPCNCGKNHAWVECPKNKDADSAWHKARREALAYRAVNGKERK